MSTVFVRRLNSDTSVVGTRHRSELCTSIRLSKTVVHRSTHQDQLYDLENQRAVRGPTVTICSASPRPGH